MYQPAVLLSLLASLALTVTASPDQAASHHKIDSYGIQRRGPKKLRKIPHASVGAGRRDKRQLVGAMLSNLLSQGGSTSTITLSSSSKSLDSLAASLPTGATIQQSTALVTTGLITASQPGAAAAAAAGTTSDPLMISLITATRSSAGPANATTSASNARVTSLLNSTAILNGAISTSFANSTTSVTTSDAPPTTEPSTTVLYVTASSTSSPTLNSATSGAVRSRALEAVASLGLAVAIGLAVM